MIDVNLTDFQLDVVVFCLFVLLIPAELWPFGSAAKPQAIGKLSQILPTATGEVLLRNWWNYQSLSIFADQLTGNTPLLALYNEITRSLSLLCL